MAQVATLEGLGMLGSSFGGLDGLIELAKDTPIALAGGAAATVAYNTLCAKVRFVNGSAFHRMGTAFALALGAGVAGWGISPMFTIGAWGALGGQIAVELLALMSMDIGKPIAPIGKTGATPPLQGLAGTYTRELYPTGLRLNIDTAEDPLLTQLGTYQ